MIGPSPAAARRARGTARESSRAPSVYTAQAMADFCEVDLKTVHHWADRGKVAHFRTEGRHLRFRRNDVVRFLRAHGYPLPDALVRARPTVALALGPAVFEGNALTLDDFAKRLGSRFAVRRHASAAIAVAHLLADAPDALLVAHEDLTLGLAPAVAALKADPELSWSVIAVVAHEEILDSLRAAGADVAVATRDVAKLTGELARTLAVA
ncbi:MAG TPA: helix-turn-helix domain-containing protein [Labilithrix sp.]|nr:helix-turn-helix domain-containing protein [Labilithrix sp.]